MVRYDRDGAVGVITLDRPRSTRTTTRSTSSSRPRGRPQDRRLPGRRAAHERPALLRGREPPGSAARSRGAELLDPPEEIRLIASVMKPTIAAVQGGCIGGGQRMVWPCDLVFCTEDAFFMDPTVTMGIGGIQSHLHTWFYGPRLAKEMIYSGMRLPASGCTRWAGQPAVPRRRRAAPRGARVRARDRAAGPGAASAGEARGRHHDGHHGPALRHQPDGRAARPAGRDEPASPGCARGLKLQVTRRGGRTPGGRARTRRGSRRR